MPRNQILHAVEELAWDLFLHPGVSEIYLFRSLVRNETNPTDVDLLLTIEEERYSDFKVRMRHIESSRQGMGRSILAIHKISALCLSLCIKGALQERLLEFVVPLDITAAPPKWQYRTELDPSFKESVLREAKKFDAVQGEFVSPKR